jgi:hypothetical protein
MRFIICPVCNEKKAHYGRGMCNNCYHIYYKKTHPEQSKAIRKRTYAKFKMKYNTDPEFRKKCLDKQRKYLSENKEKINKRTKEYLKSRHPILRKIRVGYLCQCGAIEKTKVQKESKHPSSTFYKCPSCGADSMKKRVMYNRFTGEIVEEKCVEKD